MSQNDQNNLYGSYPQFQQPQQAPQQPQYSPYPQPPQQQYAPPPYQQQSQQQYQQPQAAPWEQPQQAPQQEAFDPSTYVMDAPAQSQAGDFRRWPEEADSIILNFEVEITGPPETTTRPMKNDRTGQMEMKTRTVVPLRFEVFGDTTSGFDLDGMTVREWFNPSMNERAHMFGLVKAIKHNRVNPDEPVSLSMVHKARVQGLVTVGPPAIDKQTGQVRMDQQTGKPVRYPNVKTFMPYKGELNPGSAQEQFLAAMAGQPMPQQPDEYPQGDDIVQDPPF